MTTNEPMGEVINLPVRPTAIDPEPVPTAPGIDAPDGAGEVLEGKVLVDQPDTGRRLDIRALRLADTGQRRPIIAPWLRDRDEARATE